MQKFIINTNLSQTRILQIASVAIKS